MSYWMAVRRRLAAIALAGIDIAKIAINYTGNMTDEIVTMGDGNLYRLLTLTSSGTLSIEKEVKADIWLCGGGANGRTISSISGGGGGYVNSALSQMIQAETAVVGAASGASSFGSIVSANGASDENGGSGGGQGGYLSYVGTGAGVTTYPFGDTAYFNGKPHCAGGGGGRFINSSNGTDVEGGAGGSNGSNGSSTGSGYMSGGLLGGGKGGNPGSSYSVDGNAATFYGSGGGGGGYSRNKGWPNGGAGYQGVIYIRMLIKQFTVDDIQFVEYIQSSGTQYIDTRVNPTQATKMELDAEFLGSAGDNVAGVRNYSTDTNRFGIISFGSANKLGAFFGAASVQGAAFDKSRHSYTLDSSALVMDGTSYAVKSGITFECTYPITLGAWNNGSNGVACNSSKIYACKLYNDGTLVRDLVPCYRKLDNVAGMWDKVEGRFYANAGSGSFVVGGNV